jgi:hypothetical protein
MGLGAYFLYSQVTEIDMKIGDKVKGYTYDIDENEILVSGTYEFITNDPEDYVQAIGIRTIEGQLYYCDEALVQPLKA